MKKILAGLLALFLIVGGASYSWYKINYGGTNYYIQIHEDGKKIEEKSQSGNIWHGYSYNQLGYTKSGQEKRLRFTAIHNLRHEAYLKLTYNKHKGVTNWQEVKKSEIPQKTLDKI